MLQLSYETCGVILAVLLTGMWVAIIIVRRKLATANVAPAFAANDTISPRHELEHRALVYLMSQKTDAILAALGQTIAQERQKLGVLVRNPAIDAALDTMVAPSAPAEPATAANPVVSAASPPLSNSAAASGTEPSAAMPVPSMEMPVKTENRPVLASAPQGGMHQGTAARPARYRDIMPLVHQGLDVAAIADELQLPEMEVAMVMRLNAA